MKSKPYIVAICGSRSDDSTTRVGLERTLAAARSVGARTELVDLREYDLPTFDADHRDAGDARDLRETVRAADALVLGTPMYHGSYSSTLKTALDYCRIEDVEGTAVGLLAVAGGGFPTPALEHLRAVCRALGAWALPHQVAIPDSHARVEDGALVDDGLAERVDELGRLTVRYAGVESFPELADAAGTAVTGD